MRSYIYIYIQFLICRFIWCSWYCHILPLNMVRAVGSSQNPCPLRSNPGQKLQWRQWLQMSMFLATSVCWWAKGVSGLYLVLVEHVHLGRSTSFDPDIGGCISAAVRAFTGWQAKNPETCRGVVQRDSKFNRQHRGARGRENHDTPL